MNNLTDEEINLIIESLLFSACADVAFDYSDELPQQMVNLAKKLKTDNTSVKNISIYTIPEEVFEDLTQQIIDEKFNDLSIINITN
jgi:hypothetical protein